MGRPARWRRSSLLRRSFLLFRFASLSSVTSFVRPQRKARNARAETALAVFATLSGAVAMARAAATRNAPATIAAAAEAFLVAALELDLPASRRRASSPRRPVKSRR